MNKNVIRGGFSQSTVTVKGFNWSFTVVLRVNRDQIKIIHYLTNFTTSTIHFFETFWSPKGPDMCIKITSNVNGAAAVKLVKDVSNSD